MRLITVLGALGVTAALATAAPAATKSVTVGDDFLRPSVLNVTKGSTVTWTWTGKDKHNVTVRSGPARFASPTQASGTFTKRLTRKGLYRIVCTLHSSKMMQTIRVR